jgi:hypothetical protein
VNNVELTTLYIPQNKLLKNKPVTVALALVKNESDIIALWLSHVCELFDLVYIVDHQSTDGTREFLVDVAKSETKIHLYSFNHPGYFQAEITNYLAQLVVQTYPNSWLFPLDADEFLNVSGREEFLSLLDKQNLEQILLLRWQNCVPLYLHSDQLMQPGFSYISPSQSFIYNKVAVSSSTLLSKNLRFIQGNHGIESKSGNAYDENHSHFLNLYHFPIRSVEHFALKCVQGFIAYSQLPLDRKRVGQGAHWKDMIDSVLISGVLNADTIRKFVVSYGQSNDLSNVNIYKLIDLNWKVNAFSVPIKQEFHTLFNRKYSFLELSQQLMELYPQYTDLQSFLRIVIENQKRIADISLWQEENKSVLMFNKLPVISDDMLEPNLYQDSSEVEILNTFVSKTFTSRETPVPSTWEGHVPFLYCLLDFVRPRRFVELGSQYGNCFFAACQMSKLLNNSIECIAIDTWAGDEHTGKYQEDVFKQFSYILHRDYPDGKYIRSFFADALPQFESGSIDLLHIDGLHTYEAVAEDYQTWLPTLSDRGIIMFHDTQEREREFGVWRLWAELETKYPSFEFEHSHGLGILLVGKNVPSNVRRLFEIIAKPGYGQLIKFLFANIGKISPIR